MPVGPYAPPPPPPPPTPDAPDAPSAGVMTRNRTFNTSSGLVQAVAQLTDMPPSKMGRPTLRHVLAGGAAAAAAAAEEEEEEEEEAVAEVAVTAADISFGGAIARWCTGWPGPSVLAIRIFVVDST